MDGLIYEKVNDPGLRAAMRDARGFCHRHSWGLVRRGAAFGAAIVMRDVVRTLQRTLADARFRNMPLLSLTRVQETLDAQQPRSSTAEAVAALGPQTPCPVCVFEGDVEGALVANFLENLQREGGLLPAYRASDGFCLSYVRQILARVSGEAAFQMIVEAQQAIWTRLEQQLSELIRKSDYRYGDEAVGRRAPPGCVRLPP
ncbi:MAG: hypothetical protein H5T69_15240 [Chloroflexi bacterium]|nr:hypothetical protein [Chloroflexota bacterium]